MVSYFECLDIGALQKLMKDFSYSVSLMKQLFSFGYISSMIYSFSTLLKAWNVMPESYILSQIQLL